MKIFIVGGSSGIGLSLAKRYVSLGNRVAICGTNEEKLKQMSRANLAVFERSEFSEFAANVNFLLLRNLASNELFFTTFVFYIVIN